MTTSDTDALSVVGESAVGMTWMAHPDEMMQRASHIITKEDTTWIIDPVDAPGLDARLTEQPPVAGVVVLLDRHTRDADTIAQRYDTSVYLPSDMDGVAEELAAPVKRIGSSLGTTGLEAYTLYQTPVWQETALYDGSTLVVPEAVGTAAYFTAGSERLGVHPMLRLTPPRTHLSGMTPDRVLVGHGQPVETDATTALSDALAGSRRRMPQLYGEIIKQSFQ